MSTMPTHPAAAVTTNDDAALNGSNSAAAAAAAPPSSATPTPALSVSVRASRGVIADYGPSAPLSPNSISASPDTDPDHRFLYFAYGSNMLPSILKLKQVHVHSARRGILRDVQLLFDLANESLVEPSYANLKRHPPGSGHAVHGVVYELEHRDMTTMDRMEGSGLSYVREEFEVELYEAEQPPATLTACAYICHADNLSGAVLRDTPPSRRYLDVLIRGARHQRLDPEYVRSLEARPFTPLPALRFTPEQERAIESRRITQAELERHGWQAYMSSTPQESWTHPLFICLKGVVFDVRGGRYSNSWKAFNAGKCLTVFTAGRVATHTHKDTSTSDASASTSPNASSNVNCALDIPTHVHEFRPEHREYVNATLMDFANTYPIVGHMEDRDKYDF